MIYSSASAGCFPRTFAFQEGLERYDECVHREQLQEEALELQRQAVQHICDGKQGLRGYLVKKLAKQAQ